jgi:hypothetical protein
VTAGISRLISTEANCTSVLTRRHVSSGDVTPRPCHDDGSETEANREAVSDVFDKFIEEGEKHGERIVMVLCD